MTNLVSDLRLDLLRDRPTVTDPVLALFILRVKPSKFGIQVQVALPWLPMAYAWHPMRQHNGYS